MSITQGRARGSGMAAIVLCAGASALRVPRRQHNVAMSDESQIVVPPSFVALFVPAGRSKPTAAREHIAARHEFCEDLASMLTDTAATQQWQLGVTEADVLQRVHQGLRVDADLVSAAEAQWVLCRLAELLNWPMPSFDVASEGGHLTLPQAGSTP